MKESAILHRIMFRCSTGYSRLFRMNIGLAWVGDFQKFTRPMTVQVKKGDVMIRQGRAFRAGLKGMSDLVGQRFGKLIVIQKTNARKWNQVVYLCKCDCGNYKLAPGPLLKIGNIKSCGCIRNPNPAPKWTRRFRGVFRIRIRNRIIKQLN